MSDVNKGTSRRLRLTSPERGRLKGLIDTRKVEIRARYGSGTDPGETALRESCEQLIGIAEEHARRGSVGAAHEALNAVRRLEVAHRSEAEITAEAITLKHEAAGGKLKEWRAAAVEDLTARAADDKVPLEVRRVQLKEALFVRDEGLQTPYRKTDHITWRLTLLTYAVGLTLVGIVLVAVLYKPDLLGEASTQPTWQVFLLATLFGLLGAGLSGGLSLFRTQSERRTEPTQGRVPEVHGATVPALFRLAFGAAAALGAAVFVLSGLIGVSANLSSVLGVAFLAGFSERVITSTAERFGAGSP